MNQCLYHIKSQRRKAKCQFIYKPRGRTRLKVKIHKNFSGKFFNFPKGVFIRMVQTIKLKGLCPKVNMVDPIIIPSRNDKMSNDNKQVPNN